MCVFYIEQFALTEASFLLVRMLQRFERIEPAVPGETEIKKDFGMAMKAADGVGVRLFG